MKPTLENSSYWHEQEETCMGEVPSHQVVTLQFAFLDVSGASIDPGVFEIGSRGDALFLCLQSVAEKLISIRDEVHSWELQAPPKKSVMGTFFGLAVSLACRGAVTADDVRQMAFSMLKTIAVEATDRDLNCRLLSASTLKVVHSTRRTWYVGSAETPPGSLDGSEVQRIGNAVRDSRDRLHLSLDDTADLSNVARRTILRLEQGNEGISIGNVARIGRAIGLRLKMDRQP